MVQTVVLKTEWMGNPAGTELRLNPSAMTGLIQRGVIDRPTLMVEKKLSVPVLFLQEWLGWPVGTKCNIPTAKAEELQSRGVVEILNSEKDETMEIKTTSLSEPPKDKMIHKPEEKKEKPVVTTKFIRED